MFHVEQFEKVTMKFHYYKDRTKYLNLLVLIFTLGFAVAEFGIFGHDVTREKVLLLVLIGLVQVAFGYEGFVLAYKRKKCLEQGEEQEGRIVGKIGRSAGVQGYFYRLIIAYPGGKFKTPYVHPRYIDRLASRKCKVWKLGDEVYAEGFELARKKKDAVEIRVLAEESEDK